MSTQTSSYEKNIKIILKEVSQNNNKIINTNPDEIIKIVLLRK